MKVSRMTVLAILMLAVIFVSAIQADELPEPKFEKYVLSNGLQVILHEDHSIPVVAVNVWYHVGSKNEKPGRTGFAHLFEHMMFQGSEHHNVLFDKSIDVFGGVNNGSTNTDRTNYWENMPSNYLEKTLWLEADRMGYLLPAMTQERLDNQRSVVKNEKRQNYDDQPYGQVRGIAMRLLYPSEHPYSWLTIGSMEDLDAASLDDVKDFFRTYYAPNNASLCIAGDFDPAQAKEWVEKYFGPIPAGPPIDRMEYWVPVLNEEIRYNMEDKVELPELYLAWHTPPFYAPGDAEFDLLSSILANGKSSRLYKALVYDNQIAQDVSAYQASREIGSTFHIVITAKEGHSLEEIEAKVDSILDDVLTNGVTPDEFTRAQTNWESGFVRNLQNIGGFGGLADMLNAYNVMVGDPGSFNWDRNRYLNTTTDKMLDYARKYLQKNMRLTMYVQPQGTLTASDKQPEMTINPGPEAEPTFTPPQIQTAKLSNGMQLYLIENHKLPLVQVNLMINSGWASDPANRPGASSLTADLLNEGTKTRNALEISDEVQRLGLNFNTTSSWDNSSINLNSLKKNLDQGLELMADVVINPTFPEEELQRQKQIYLGRIKQESVQNITVAFKNFLRNLYGANHPYGQPYTGSGTEESINAITRADLVNYYKANYLPNNSNIIVVGDITLNDAKSKLEKVFKKWQPGDVNHIEVAEVKPLDKTKIFIIDRPGSTQSSVILGNLVAPRAHDDYYLPLTVANRVLGGGSTGRLYLNLRQDKGYTYGAYSFITSRKGQGAFISYAQVQTPNTKEALVEFMKELKGITGTMPITADELKASKDNLIKGFPQDFQTLGGVAGQMGSILNFGLPLDEWQTYSKRVSAVDINQAIEAAKKRVDPNALLIMIVGDKAKIEPGIKELGLGEVVDLDI